MSDPEKYRSTMRYIGLGSQLMAMMLAAVWLGWKLDNWTAWKFPLFIITLPLIALGLSLWQLVRAFNKPKK